MAHQKRAYPNIAVLPTVLNSRVTRSINTLIPIYTPNCRAFHSLPTSASVMIFPYRPPPRLIRTRKKKLRHSKRRNKLHTALHRKQGHESTIPMHSS